MKVFGIFLGLAGLATMSAASAQQQPSMSNMLKRNAVKQVVKFNPPVSRCRVEGRGNATIQASSMVPNRCLDGANNAFLLESFRLHFNEGSDHKIKTLKMLASPRMWNAGLGDNDGNDFARAYASYAVVPGIRQFSTSGRCLEICTLSLEKKRDDEVFVLQGFSFAATANDRSIRRIAINPLAGDAVEVIFPLGRVEVHYAYVPKSMVEREITTTGRYRQGPHDMIAKPSGRRVDVISGFSFHYGSGEKFLGEIGLRSQGNNLVPIMRDKNLDQTSSWRVQQVRLKI